MKLPNLNDVEIPKRLGAAMVGMYYISRIENIYMALILAGILVVGILAQTYTDVKGKKVES